MRSGAVVLECAAAAERPACAPLGLRHSLRLAHASPRPRQQVANRFLAPPSIWLAVDSSWDNNKLRRPSKDSRPWAGERPCRAHRRHLDTGHGKHPFSITTTRPSRRDHERIGRVARAAATYSTSPCATFHVLGSHISTAPRLTAATSLPRAVRMSSHKRRAGSS